MKNFLLTLLLIGFFTGSKLGAQQPTQKLLRKDAHEQEAMYQAKWIVPDKAIGLIKLGDDVQNALGSMGVPDDQDAAMGKAVFTWDAFHNPKKGKVIVYGERKMGMSDGQDTMYIKQIRVTSAWYSTANGIKVGTPLKNIRKSFSLKKEATFTENGKQYTLYHTDQGISFEINPKGVCTGIVIHDSNSDPLSTYMPFYSDVKKID